MCLLSDRDIGGGGVEVEFFGERTTLPGGPATLALRTGAPLLPAGRVLRAAGDGHHARRPPAGARPSATAACATTCPRHPGARRRARGAHPRARPSSGTCCSPTGRATAGRAHGLRRRAAGQADQGHGSVFGCGQPNRSGPPGTGQPRSRTSHVVAHRVRLPRCASASSAPTA